MSESNTPVPNSMSSNLPTLDSLLRLIANFQGSNAYEINPEKAAGRRFGNHGDGLMYEVFERVLERANINLVNDPEKASLYVIRPNGALLETYEFPRILSEQLQSLPDKPLVIFPSSALFPSIDPAFIFKGRSSPTFWLFRERFSFEQISSKWGESLKINNVELYLDHDVVASGNEFIPQIIGGPVGKKFVLLAGRIDSETSKDFRASDQGDKASIHSPLLPLKRAVLEIISKKSSTPLGRLLTKAIYQKRFDLAAERLMASLPEEIKLEIETADLPFKNVDLSSVVFHSYESYKEGIRNSAIVVTDRLHVALPAAIIGKRVVLIEAGYHKLTGVYEQSLKSLPNVTLLNSYANEK